MRSVKLSNFVLSVVVVDLRRRRRQEASILAGKREGLRLIVDEEP